MLYYTVTIAKHVLTELEQCNNINGSITNVGIMMSQYVLSIHDKNSF